MSTTIESGEQLIYALFLKTPKVEEKGKNNQKNKNKYLPTIEHATIESIHISMIPANTSRLLCIV